ncbi:MAG: PKD domain-containing protein [Thermoplasmata archaeon]|nr:MAG: PKD domain-containing protein [Thermoplasmata archaeon]
MTSPSVADGMAFVVHGEPFVTALNESTGETIWCQEIPGLPSQPVIANGKVFVSALIWGNVSEEVHVYCFNEFTGELIWQLNSNDFGWSVSLFPWIESAPLTAVNNRLYFGLSVIPPWNESAGSMIICLNDSSGELIWNVSVADYGLDYINVPLTIADNKILASSGGILYALNENNGELLWSFFNNGPSWFESAPAVADGKVFIGCDNTNLFFCLDVNNGNIIWQTSLDTNYSYTTPAIANEMVFFGAVCAPPFNFTNADPIFALDISTGEVLWIFETSAIVLSSPAVADFKVFNSYDDGSICALNWSSGIPIWTYPTQSPSWFWHQSLAIAYGKLFVCMGDTLYVFGSGDPRNIPPIANAEPDIQMVYTGEEAWFSANGSYDPDGFIVSYEWDFGDGNFGSGITTTHVYTIPGFYNVTLTVTDNESSKGYDIVFVIVEDGQPPENQPPVAVAEPDIQTIFIGGTALFSGNGSYDPDGYIVSYEWDFGDGTNGSGVTISHIYFEPGNYTVILTVRDNDNAIDIDTVLVIVQETPSQNRPPVADAGSDRFATPFEVLTFDGSGSFDLDGTIVSYDWDFGDGCIDFGMIVTHTYPDYGTYIVTLMVTDDKGAADTETCIVFLENEGPNAVIEPETQTIYIGEKATFSGNCSYDQDSNIISYYWDFGDGSTGVGVSPEHVYPEIGIYTVTLTVIDNGFNAARANAIVIVQENPTPQNIPPSANTKHEQVAYTNNTVRFDGSSSNDPDGNIGSYEWDFGDGTHDTGVTASHIYPAPGIYTITLVVIDDDGASGAVTSTIEIIDQEEQSQPAHLEISKIKVTGPDEVQIHTYAEWTLEVVVTNKGGSGAIDVVFSDIIPTQLELMSYSSSFGWVTIEDNPGNMSPASVTWSIGALTPNSSVSLVYIVGTIKNPAGEQEFTSPDTYIINKECSAVGKDETTGEIIFANFISTIEIIAVNSGNSSETIIESKEPTQTSIIPVKPVLILTAGMINIATFEEGVERTVPVEVAAYFGDVYNVHIELVDDGGLEIEIIPIVQDVHEGKIVKFYIKIKRPEISDDIQSTGITIKLKAIGDEAESNEEYIDVMIHGETKDSSPKSESEMVSTLGALTILAVIGAIIGRRFL